MAKGPEAQIQKAIMEWLAAKRILCFRMNSGATVATYNGKTRMIRYGTPGMAYILAFKVSGVDRHGTWCEHIDPVWIEVKAAKGRKSEDQKSFQALVEREGHRYIVAKSIEDVKAAL